MTPDPNTAAAIASRYRWESHRDANGWSINHFQPGRGVILQSIAMEMGGASRYFSQVSGSGVDVTLLIILMWQRKLITTESLIDGHCM